MADRDEGAKRTLIFVYGTLKRGFPNHYPIQDQLTSNDAVYLGSYITVHQFPLVCGPYGIPFLLNLPQSDCHHRVHGELYAVSSLGLEVLDEFEGTSLGHYERLPIQVCGGSGSDGGGEVVDAEAYYGHRCFAEGMWEKNGRVGFDVYTEDMARKYVKREDRPKGRSFLEAIRSFCSSDSIEVLGI
ncbi:unnamed protein product [Ilex paraguariensis]|uniref:Gamma-glutamylcyclotransferase family protein n=1 Tax=Ilex paraguariensis TaxID=185542 RepID=A0ABC8TIU6_9AQUA